MVGITSLCNAVGGQQLPLASPGRMSAATPISFRDAKPILERLAARPLHAIGDSRVIYSDHPDDTDDIVWYRRQ